MQNFILEEMISLILKAKTMRYIAGCISIVFKHRNTRNQHNFKCLCRNNL